MPTLERIAIYLRYLHEMESGGIDTISSGDMEKATGVPATQFRKDLSYFGEFGRPGVGYRVSDLQNKISHILKVHREQPVLLVGAGHLGSALVGYTGLRTHNFNIVAVFDNNLGKVGKQLWDVTIEDIEDIEESNLTHQAKMAIVAVPAAAAQGVVDRLVKAGVKVILNFAPTSVRVPEGVTVRNVCFIQELTILSFYLSADPVTSSAP